MSSQVIFNIIELVVVGGLLLWLIKISYDLSQRVARLEGVFDYIREDHERIRKLEVSNH